MDSQDLRSRRTRSQVILNHDILCNIRSLSERQEVARLMRTCWALYRGGARLIFRGSVVLREERQVTSFLYFLLAEKGARICHFLDLKLSLYVSEFRPLSPSTSYKLIEIFQRTNYLENLRLSSIDEILESSDNITDAIAGLRSLRYFDAGESCSPTAFHLIQNMKSPLLAIRFAYGEDLSINIGEAFLDKLDSDDLPYYHPLVLCTAFAPTLEKMDVNCRRTFNEDFRPPAEVPIPVFPNMRELILQDDWLLARPYIAAFPNLRMLSIIRRPLCTLRYWGAGNEIYLEENREQQLLHGTWEHVEIFDGSLISLYCLGLTSRIPRVRLRAVEEEERGLLRPVLDDARPVELNIKIYGGFLDNDIAVLIGSPGCASLKELSLHVKIGRLARDSNIVESANRLLDSLTNLSELEFLEFRLAEWYLDSAPCDRRSVVVACSSDEEGDVPPPPLHNTMPRTPAPLAPIELSMNAFDPSDYTRQAFERITTLKEAICEMNGPRRRSRIFQQRRGEVGEMVESQVPQSHWSDW